MVLFIYVFTQCFFSAVIAESFERIHRSNLVGMGIIPLQFLDGQNASSLGLTGRETYSIDVPDDVKPGQILDIKAIIFLFILWYLKLLS